MNIFIFCFYTFQMQPRNSPLTVTTSTSKYESTSRNHVSSPRNYSLSPTSQIERVSPVNYVSASTQRVASPINMQRVTSPITTITHRVTTPLTSPLTVKVSVHYYFVAKTKSKRKINFKCYFNFRLKLLQTGAGETYKMTEKLSSYKTSSNYTQSSDDTRRSPSYPIAKRISSPGKNKLMNYTRTKATQMMYNVVFSDPVDSSSNVRVSGAKNANSSRRDSWDVLNKTRNILSHNSLESLANMTEGQLNTDLSYTRPRGLDSETEYNTRYNKFELVEKRETERRGSDDNSERYKVYSYV